VKVKRRKGAGELAAKMHAFYKDRLSATRQVVPPSVDRMRFSHYYPLETYLKRLTGVPTRDGDSL
jgi:hypothetical protein